MKKLTVLLLSLLLCLSLAACSDKPKDDDKTLVRVGTVGEYNEYWKPVIEQFAKENITIELVKFNEYPMPNRALNDGDIEMNAFQHYAYLNQEIADLGYDLTVLCETIVAPLGVYSDKIKNLNELKEGDQIVIPNDATNGGRALKMFETAGLIVMDPAVGYTGNKSNIKENKLNLDFVEVSASMTPSYLPDVACAVVNSGNAITSELHKTDKLIYEEVMDETINPNVLNLINVIAIRTEDKDNELYARIATAFRSQEVADIIHKEYPGVIIPAWEFRK